MDTRDGGDAPRLRQPTRKAEGAYRHGDLKNALLDEAERLVVERAGAHFSLREIASRLGVRHAAVYRHFVSREALLAAVAARAFEQMKQAFDDARKAAGGDFEAWVDGLSDGYLAMVDRRPGAYRVMFADLRVPDEALDRAARACFDELLACYAEGQMKGLVRTDMAAIAVAASSWAALHGFAMLLIDRRLVEDCPGGGQPVLRDALTTILRSGWGRPGNACGKA